MHLIETGKTRPTLQTLQLIATRTEQPLQYFLDDQEYRLVKSLVDQPRSRVAEYQDLLARKEYQAVIEAAGAIRLEQLDPLEAVRLRIALAEAYLQLAQPENALAHLAEAITYARKASNTWLLVEALDWQIAALHLKESPDAVAVGEEALALCRQLDPIPHEIEMRILSHLGAAYVGQHRWTDAIRSYEAAVLVAGVLRDLGRLARMHNDLSIAYRRLNDLVAAERHASKSVHLHEMLNDQISLARAENNLAVVLRRQGSLAEAKRHAINSLHLCDELNIEVGRAHPLLTLAEIELLQDQPSDARAHVDEAIELAKRLNERSTLAEAYEWLGRIAAKQGDAAATDAAFRTALDLLAELGASDRLANSHAAYAQVLEDRGDVVAALEQWKSAATAHTPEFAAVPSEPINLAEEKLA